jgi:hypothetical protein
MLCVFVVSKNFVRVDVGHTGVAAFRFSGRPAGDLDALKACFTDKIYHFLIAHRIRDGTYKTK